MKKTVGVIGTGIMGAGMAEQLLKQGFPVVVWNRTADKTTPLVKLGAKAAGSPAELASQVDTILLVVRDDAAVWAVVLSPEGALRKARPGTAFINMSTVTPALARKVGAAIEAQGCAFMEAPMTGSKAAAASGKLGFLVSGSPEVVKSQLDILRVLGQTITDFGPLGNSAVFKLANNQLAATLIRAMGESLALTEAAGLERELVVESLVTTATRVCGLKKDKLLRRDWSTDFALDLMCKDLDQALQTSAELKVPAPLVAAVRDIYRKAAEGGGAELDFAAVGEFN
jgi:3-hydroxyisobutyrate dehydrogenase